MTKVGVFEREIPFQKIRVNREYVPVICDFDFAEETDVEATWVTEKIVTIRLIAKGIFEEKLVPHRGFHNCETRY